MFFEYDYFNIINVFDVQNSKNNLFDIYDIKFDFDLLQLLFDFKYPTNRLLFSINSKIDESDNFKSCYYCKYL